MKLPSSRPNEQVVEDFTVGTSYTVAQVLFALALPVLFYGLAQLLDMVKFLTPELKPIVFTLFFWAGALAGLYIIATAVYLRLARHYFVTNERILQVNGWLAQKTISIDYATITDITVEQDIFERFLLQTGSLLLDTAGQPTEEIKLYHIASPAKLRDQILEQAEACRKVMPPTYGTTPAMPGHGATTSNQPATPPTV